MQIENCVVAYRTPPADQLLTVLIKETLLVTVKCTVRGVEKKVKRTSKGFYKYCQHKHGVDDGSLFCLN